MKYLKISLLFVITLVFFPAHTFAWSIPTAALEIIPTCNTSLQGTMYEVTDALLPAALATVAGSGAVKVGVTCNGSNLIVQ